MPLPRRFTEPAVSAASQKLLEIRHVPTAIPALLVHLRRRTRRRWRAGAEPSAPAALSAAVTARGAGLLDPQSCTQTTVPRPAQAQLNDSNLSSAAVYVAALLGTPSCFDSV